MREYRNHIASDRTQQRSDGLYMGGRTHHKACPHQSCGFHHGTVALGAVVVSQCGPIDTGKGLPTPWAFPNLILHVFPLPPRKPKESLHQMLSRPVVVLVLLE